MKAQAPRLKLAARTELADYPLLAQFAPDGRAVALLGGDGGVWLWKLDAEPQQLGRHAGCGLSLSWSAGAQQFASSGGDGEVRVWQPASAESRLIHAAAEWSEHIDYSPNGKLLAVATGKRLQVFDHAGRELHTIAASRTTITAIAWRPKHNALVCVGNGGARVHTIGATPDTLELPWQGACLTACWNADGRVLAAGMQDGSVHFWNVASGMQSQMRGYGAKVTLTEWSASGRWLVTASGDNLVLWDFAGRGPEGSEPLQLAAHTGRVQALACQPRGAFIASAGRDRRLLLWQPQLGNKPVDADLLEDDVASLTWSRDGRMLLAGARGGALRLYLV